jgi:hypothetical protein
MWTFFGLPPLLLFTVRVKNDLRYLLVSSELLYYTVFEDSSSHKWI